MLLWWICSYPHCVLWCRWVAVLGQNVGAGSRDVEVCSIKCLKVVLTPRPADPVSILALVRYWEGNGQLTRTRVIKWFSLMWWHKWVSAKLKPLLNERQMLFYHLFISHRLLFHLNSQWKTDTWIFPLFQEIPAAGCAKKLPKIFPKLSGGGGW